MPPANQVWGKVIFSEARVSHSVHRGMHGREPYVLVLGVCKEVGPGCQRGRSILVVGSLEAPYSLNWGAQEIWGKGGEEILPLL